MEKKEKIFISQRIENLDKSIIIEEDENAVWAYLMDRDFKKIEFDGFICARQPPIDSLDNLDNQRKGNPPPLIKKFANEFSYISVIQDDQIKIEPDIEHQLVNIIIRDELYLSMDLKTNKSYSKALSKDGPYGLALKDDEYEP